MMSVRDRLPVDLEGNRNSCEVIKVFSRELKSTAVREITEATASGNLEDFHPFLDMKSNRPTDHLAAFNLGRPELAGTDWMRNAIGNVISTQ